MKTMLLSQLADCSQPEIAITVDSGTRYRIYNDSRRADQSILLHIKEQAHCEWLDVYTDSRESAESSYNITLESRSMLTHSYILTNTKKATVSLTVKMAGKESAASFYGFYGLQADESVQITTNQHHVVGDTTSTVLYKGILADAAQAVFNGMITIDQQAGKSCAAQYNKNLLLSNKAKAISVPSLQVLTNDVSCKHGSAIGRWDEQQLWYLLSRGLSKEQAQQLLLKAFLADAFLGITDQEMKESMYNDITSLFFPRQIV